LVSIDIVHHHQLFHHLAQYPLDQPSHKFHEINFSKSIHMKAISSKLKLIGETTSRCGKR
jgi:uncharacterized protein with HEPN domain